MKERENRWGPFMGGEGGVMADSQVSGLGSGPGRWWSRGIGVQVAGMLRHDRACGVEPPEGSWLQAGMEMRTSSWGGVRTLLRTSAVGIPRRSSG